MLHCQAIATIFDEIFSAIAQRGVHRYLKECGFDPDEPPDRTYDDCWEAGTTTSKNYGAT